MQPTDGLPPDADEPRPDAPAEATPAAPGQPAGGGSRTVPRSGGLLALAAAAGTLAGLISWGGGEATLTAFKPRLEMVFSMSGPKLNPNRQSEIRAETRNAALGYAWLGAALGVAMGVAGGVARRSAGRGAFAASAGLVAGGLIVFGVSLLLVPLFYRAQIEDPLSPDLTIPLAIHAGSWAVAGAVGGLAFGIGMGADRRQVARAAIGGLIGGAVGAAAFELLGAIAFPLADTPRPIALTWPARLAARLLAAIPAAVLAAATIARGPTGRPTSG